MRPIKLTIEGFTSFRSRQELDFTELDLFAITGATGAGKSSILDAITYALYGEVARKSKIDELVSQGAKNLKVEFQFQVKQIEYKAIRTWRYRPSSPDTKFLLDRFSQGQWERCDRSVEDILGMDFDTFTRVIVLPQGKFDEFLKGNNGKRHEMLRDLAGLNIFEEMRKQASDRLKDCQAQRGKIEGEIAGLQAPTEEEVKAKQTNLEDLLKVTIPKLAENAANAQKFLEEEQRLFEQIQRLYILQQDLQQIKLKESEIEQLNQDLKQAQTASHLNSTWVQVKDIRQRFTEAEKNLEDATNEFNQAKSELDTQKENCDRIQTQADEIETQLEKRGQELATAKAYEEQYRQAEQEVSQAESKLKQKTQQHSDLQVEVNKAQEAVTDANNELETVNETLAQTFPDNSRLQILDRVISLIPQWEAITEQKEEAKENLNKRVQEKEQKLSEQIRSQEQLDIFKEKLQETEIALKEARANNDRIAQTNQAATLRASLHSGDDCPVCGGKYPEAHLLPSLPDASIIDIQLLEKSFKDAQENEKHARTSLNEIEGQLELLQQQEIDLQQNLEKFQTRLTESHNQISTFLNTKQWDVQILKKEHEQLSKQDEDYKTALAQQQQINAELEKLKQRLQFAQKELISTQNELATATEEVDRRKKELQGVQNKLNQITQGKSYDNLKQQLEIDKKDWEEQKQKAETQFWETQNRFTEAKTIYNKADETSADTKSQQQQIESQWKTALSEKDFTEASFQQAQATETQQQEWQNAIASHEEDKNNISIRIQTIEETIGEQTANETTLENRREAKKLADEQLQKSRKQQTEFELWLKDTASKQEKNQDLLKRQAKVQQQEQTYKTLARDLQRDRFQAYILEHLERELVTRATVLLRNLTDNRYTLKIKDKEYYVEDNWNAGEMRRIRTLSGGETFAASLSMALSLSEKLSMGIDLGCLFLDEGFGTLDRETLDSVTRILESLRQQDRLIGIITHIPALAEQFTQIKVYKSEQGSNLVVEHC